MLWAGSTSANNSRTSKKRSAQKTATRGRPKRAKVEPPVNADRLLDPVIMELLDKIEILGKRLPPNTLDQLIDELGGPDKVGEVSTERVNEISNASRSHYYR